MVQVARQEGAVRRLVPGHLCLVDPDPAQHRLHWYVLERGPILATGTAGRADAVRLSGLTLVHLERGQFDDARTAGEAKSLMRMLIHHCLNGQELSTRALVRDLQRLEDAA